MPLASTKPMRPRPPGLKRISWKPAFSAIATDNGKHTARPPGLKRISWKQCHFVG
ncbi:hypothetical protein M595_5072 [Lyngbya aestuarii BL J]|uniref:Uncharacterized protein n=1 Tax=Lyngbya aestuarii BL J TaxID=1348334 RepID=U7QAY8_9CYAN|nr:hypothetical protein M595_5072 [Lyngbya aestuarii BL J]